MNADNAPEPEGSRIVQIRSTEPGLTSDSFASLLDCFDQDRELAGEKYEDLRRTLIRFFEWRGAPFPEDHADETFNRVARKLGAGVEIRNIGAYCYEVARLVFLESTKGPDSRRESLDSVMPELVAVDDSQSATEKELSLTCLEACLRTLPNASAELILEYYRQSEGSQVSWRKAIAERLGLRRDALANRVQRLRDKLEHCVSVCMRGKSAI